MNQINKILKILKTPGAFASVEQVDIFFEKSLYEIYAEGQKSKTNEIKALFEPTLVEYKKLKNSTQEELQDFLIENIQYFDLPTFLDLLEILSE